MLKKTLYFVLATIFIVALLGTFIGWQLSVPTSKAELSRMQTAEHYAKGKFSNPEGQSSYDITRQALKDALFGTGAQVTPIGEIPIVAVDTDFLDTRPKPGLRYLWLGHSSVLLEVDGLRLMLDPVLSERASPFSFIGPSRFHPPPIKLDDIRGIDVALISHNHYDHMDQATLQRLATNGSQILVPLGVQPQLLEWEIPARQVHSFDWNEELIIDGIRLIATPARHYSNRGTFDYKESSWNSWTIIGSEHRVFYSGDTGTSREFVNIGHKFGPFDLGVIKVGAYGPGQAWLDVHMLPEDSVKTALEINAKRMLPVHWGTFNLAYHSWSEPAERTLKSASDANLPLCMPRPGEWINHDEDCEVQSWWRDVE